ncbi:carbohydrate kinase family protein [Hymenobacter tenuis]
MNPSAAIVCIGECLWDMLPTGRRPGGAPLNVAAQLGRLGQPVQLISRVGNDELGAELLACLPGFGLGSELIQRSQTHLTGVVKVNLSAGHRQYKIVEPVAWDYLQHTEELRAAVASGRMLVYGSLAARNPVTRETLYRLLQVASYKVFDVNLRRPHYSRLVVNYLLRQADLVKLTLAELEQIMDWHGQEATVATALPWLAAHYQLDAVCLYQEASQVTLWQAPQLHTAELPRRESPDELGRSDVFLGRLLAHWGQESAAACLQAACAATFPAAAGP